MQVSYYTLLIIVLIYILYNNLQDQTNMVSVISEIDNKQYKVVEEYKNHKKAADMIAELNLFAEKVIKKMHAHYVINGNMVNNLAERERGQHIIKKLIENYDPNVVQENMPQSIKLTSYTLNKGEKIALCLREKISGQHEFHDMETMKFVLLHELAHITTYEYDHSMGFWNNFKFVLDFTHKHNLYISKNYKKNNTHYCGIIINFNPFYDL